MRACDQARVPRAVPRTAGGAARRSAEEVRRPSHSDGGVAKAGRRRGGPSRVCAGGGRRRGQRRPGAVPEVEEVRVAEAGQGGRRRDCGRAGGDRGCGGGGAGRGPPAKGAARTERGTRALGPGPGKAQDRAWRGRREMPAGGLASSGEGEGEPGPEGDRKSVV